MERIKRDTAGSTRRSVLSGTGLLLTGAFLGVPQRTEAQEGLDSPPASAGLAGDRASLISDLVVANRILFDQGVVDGYGHVSVRHPVEPNHFPVTGDRRKLYQRAFHSRRNLQSAA